MLQALEGLSRIAALGGAPAEGGDAASASSVAAELVAEVQLEQDAVETQPRPAVEETAVPREGEAAGAGAAAGRILDDLVCPPSSIPREGRARRGPVVGAICGGE